MVKRTPSYKLVLGVLVLACVATYWARTRVPIVLTGADLSLLPAQLDEWCRDGRDRKPGKEALGGWMVGAKDFLDRTYTSPDGARVSLMVVYKGLDRRGWHLSEMCFSGSGFNVTRSRTQIPYAGRNVSAVKLVAVDPTSETKHIAVYLFAQARHTESAFARQQLSMALSRVRPTRHGWAFVRVTSPVDISESEEDTMRHIRGFLASASGPLVKALTGTRRVP